MPEKKSGPHIHLLNPTSELHAWDSQIREQAKKVFDRVASLISLVSVGINIYDDPERAIKGLGIGWRIPSLSEINLLVDPKFHDFENTIQELLPLVIARQLYVARRWQVLGYGRSLSADIKTEGLASHFPPELGYTHVQPWDVAVEKDKQAGWIEKMQLASEKEKFYKPGRWLYGEEPNIVPRWTGFTIGYLWVKEYLASHPDQTSSTLIDVPLP